MPYCSMGNDILPKAATPMTAALTIMEYSENVSAEVDFFTQQDIDEIKVKYDLFQKALDSKVKRKKSWKMLRELREKRVLILYRLKSSKNAAIKPNLKPSGR